MKRTLAFLALALPSAAWAQATADLTLTYTVEDTLACSAVWVENSTPLLTKTVAPSDIANSQITLDCTFNGIDPTFDITATVDHLGGWEDRVNLSAPGPEFNNWGPAPYDPYGTPHAYEYQPVDSGGAFTGLWAWQGMVSSTQAPADYVFDISFTVTRL